MLFDPIRFFNNYFLLQECTDAIKKKEIQHHTADIIEVLAKRSPELRLKMTKVYPKLYPKRKLEDDLQSITDIYFSEYFRDTILGLFEEKEDMNVRFSFPLRKSKSNENDDDILFNTEVLSLVLCMCLTKKQKNKIERIKNDSEKMWTKQTFLKRMLVADRLEEEGNDKQVIAGVKALMEGGAFKSDPQNQDSCFVRMLTTQSFSYLRKLFKAYAEKKDITSSIESTDLSEKTLMINVVNCICDPDKYVVDNIEIPSMLIHTILSRSEDNLQDIKSKLGSKKLDKTIKKTFYFDENVCQLLLHMSGKQDQYHEE